MKKPFMLLLFATIFLATAAANVSAAYKPVFSWQVRG